MTVPTVLNSLQENLLGSVSDRTVGNTIELVNLRLILVNLVPALPR